MTTPEIALSDDFCGDESEACVLFPILRQLTTGPKDKRVSTDAKPLYGKLRDRMRLSAGTADPMAVRSQCLPVKE